MNREEKIQALRDIIKIKSVNGDELLVAQYLMNMLKGENIKTELIQYDKNRASLVAEFSNEGKKIGLTGHMDVVSEGKSSDWQHDPYGAEIVGNKLYGRGTSDMKAGLMAMTIAFMELAEENFEGTIRLLFTVGEEIGQYGSEDLSNRGYADDLDALIVGEPAYLGNISQITYAHMGSFNYKISSKGLASHSSMPEMGVNAIDNLLDFRNILKNKMAEICKNYENEIFGHTIFNITQIEGGSQINSIPDNASFSGNIRTIPEFDNDMIKEFIEELVDEFNGDNRNLKFEVTQSSMPVQSNPNSKLIKIIRQCADTNKLENINNPDIFNEDFINEIKEKKEIPVSATFSRGTTDGSNFFNKNKKMDFAIYGPGGIEVSHKVDEFVYIDRYLKFIDLYKEILQKYIK